MNSAITLTPSYAPYGEVTQSVGTSQTNYAFTGEMPMQMDWYISGRGTMLRKTGDSFRETLGAGITRDPCL